MSDANKIAKYKDPRYNNKKDKKSKKSKLKNTKFYGYTNTKKY